DRQPIFRVTLARARSAGYSPRASGLGSGDRFRQIERPQLGIAPEARRIRAVGPADLPWRFAQGPARKVDRPAGYGARSGVARPGLFRTRPMWTADPAGAQRGGDARCRPRLRAIEIVTSSAERPKNGVSGCDMDCHQRGRITALGRCVPAWTDAARLDRSELILVSGQSAASESFSRRPTQRVGGRVREVDARRAAN